MLNLFYKEPETDRWIFGDRYPRRMVRRILRGPRRPGGQERVFLNLKQGLDRLGVPYRDNDFSWAKRNPSAPVGIIGKPHVLDMMEWKNPILFGASIMSHPLDSPGLLDRRPIERVLVPGEWMRDMCEPYWGDKVQSWPVGIDTELWKYDSTPKEFDVLLYDKVMWEHDHYSNELLEPIRRTLKDFGLSFVEIRYGYYREEDFKMLLKRSRSMVFLCEHETQGIAYQQALSCGVPILAWDRGGFWQDPEFYPERVKYGPVSSVPYWDSRCGEKFSKLLEFEDALNRFWDGCSSGKYASRDYIVENLTLERAAQDYLAHWNETFGESGVFS